MAAHEDRVIFITGVGNQASYDVDKEKSHDPSDYRLSEVYLRLASIVQRPEAFGLGASAPKPLTDTLEAMMQTLGQVIDEKEQPIPEDRAGEGTVAGCGSTCGC